MNINFEPFQESNIATMLRWLNNDHVKKWWNKDIGLSQIEYHEYLVEKYKNYSKGFSISDNEKKPIESYLINLENESIGYIQIYNPKDFKNEYSISNLPDNSGAIDWFIGEENYLGKNLGSSALKEFLKK